MMKKLGSQKIPRWTWDTSTFLKDLRVEQWTPESQIKCRDTHAGPSNFWNHSLLLSYVMLVEYILQVSHNILHMPKSQANSNLKQKSVNFFRSWICMDTSSIYVGVVLFYWFLQIHLFASSVTFLFSLSDAFSVVLFWFGFIFKWWQLIVQQAHFGDT